MLKDVDGCLLEGINREWILASWWPRALGRRQQRTLLARWPGHLVRAALAIKLHKVCPNWQPGYTVLLNLGDLCSGAVACRQPSWPLAAGIHHDGYLARKGAMLMLGQPAGAPGVCKAAMNSILAQRLL